MEGCSAGGYALRSGSLADAPQRMKGKLVSAQRSGRQLHETYSAPVSLQKPRIYAPTRCLKHLETHAMASSTFPSLWNYELAAGLYAATTHSQSILAYLARSHTNASSRLPARAVTMVEICCSKHMLCLPGELCFLINSFDWLLNVHQQPSCITFRDAP